MGNLWLSYAWVDNEAEDVDYVAGKLRSHGIEVLLDRTQIIAGRRLWPQIDAHLADPNLQGWAIYATENSLRSEPCQEELAYALDRALRAKGSDFPIIGIFPAPMERKLIPSSIATRLYVTLKDENWSSRVNDALNGRSTQKTTAIAPYEFTVHQQANEWVYEMRPRDGVWHPPMVLVLEEAHQHCQIPFSWARKHPQHRPAMYQYGDIPSTTGPDGSRWRGWRVDEQVDNTKSVYLVSRKKLTRIAFGPPSKQVVLDLH